MALVPALMGAKVLIDVVTSLELAREEWDTTYCQTASVIARITVFFALPEALRAPC